MSTIWANGGSVARAAIGSKINGTRRTTNEAPGKCEAGFSSKGCRRVRVTMGTDLYRLLQVVLCFIEKVIDIDMLVTWI